MWCNLQKLKLFHEDQWDVVYIQSFEINPDLMTIATSLSFCPCDRYAYCSLLVKLKLFLVATEMLLLHICCHVYFLVNHFWAKGFTSFQSSEAGGYYSVVFKMKFFICVSQYLCYR